MSWPFKSAKDRQLEVTEELTKMRIYTNELLENEQGLLKDQIETQKSTTTLTTWIIAIIVIVIIIAVLVITLKNRKK